MPFCPLPIHHPKIDVTQSPSLDEDEATRFFARAAENLGRAGTAAGVHRSVVLSIIGVDQVADRVEALA